MTKLPRLLPWQALHATATLVMQLAVAIFPRAAGASPEMSVTLVDLVLKARMPLDMQSRAAQKLVLVCLAKVCQNENGLDCYPSRATLALAAERSERTVDAFLDDLQRRGFISETDKPRRHRPRTWRLHVDRLLDLQPVATLDRTVDAQPVAGLPSIDAAVDRVLDRQFQPVDLQLRNLDSQFQRLDSQQVATERSERSYERSEQEHGAVAPVPSPDDNDPEKSYAVVKRLAFDAIDTLGTSAQFSELSGALKDLTAKHGIPYDARTVGAALTFALSSRRTGMRATA